MSFDTTLDQILADRDKVIWEGVILNVNTMISKAISVPEGEYRVLLEPNDNCKLISTKEASKEQSFEVFRPTLAGFFNPEVHRKVVSVPNGKILAENNAIEFTKNGRRTSSPKDRAIAQRE